MVTRDLSPSCQDLYKTNAATPFIGAIKRECMFVIPKYFSYHFLCMYNELVDIPKELCLKCNQYILITELKEHLVKCQQL